MQYFYAIMWLVIGLVLIFSISKENKVFYFAGGFFLLLGLWWLLDAILPVNLFDGGWGIALKVITGVALVTLTIAFIRHYRAGNQKGKEKESDKDGGE